MPQFFPVKSIIHHSFIGTFNNKSINLLNPISADIKPSTIKKHLTDKDIYVDFFSSKKDAINFIKTNKY